MPSRTLPKQKKSVHICAPAFCHLKEWIFFIGNGEREDRRTGNGRTGERGFLKKAWQKLRFPPLRALCSLHRRAFASVANPELAPFASALECSFRKIRDFPAVKCFIFRSWKNDDEREEDEKKNNYKREDDEKAKMKKEKMAEGNDQRT